MRFPSAIKLDYQLEKSAASSRNWLGLARLRTGGGTLKKLTIPQHLQPYHRKIRSEHNFFQQVVLFVTAIHMCRAAELPPHFHPKFLRYSSKITLH